MVGPTLLGQARLWPGWLVLGCSDLKIRGRRSRIVGSFRKGGLGDPKRRIRLRLTFDFPTIVDYSRRSIFLPIPC